MSEGTVSELGICDASDTTQRLPGAFGVELPQERQSCGCLRSFLVIAIAKVNVASWADQALS